MQCDIHVTELLNPLRIKSMDVFMHVAFQDTIPGPDSPTHTDSAPPVAPASQGAYFNLVGSPPRCSPHQRHHTAKVETSH